MQWLRRNFDTAFLVCQVVMDGLCIIGAFVLSVRFFSDSGLSVGNSLLGALSYHRSLGIVMLFMTLFCFWLLGMYQWQKSILNVEEYRASFKAVCLAFLLTASYFFLFKRFEDTLASNLPWIIGSKWEQYLEALSVTKETAGGFRKGPMITMAAITFILVALQRFCSFGVLTWLHAHGHGNSNVVVYGAGPLAKQVEQKMKLFPFLGFNFIGFIDDDDQLGGRRIGQSKVLGSDKDLEKLCTANMVRRVIVAKPELDGFPLQNLCTRLERLGIEYMLVPRLHHLYSQRFVIESLDTIPLLHPVRKSGKLHVRVFKRVFDLLFGSLLFVTSLPIFLLVSIVTFAKSKGPIFFSQTRVGKNGRTFRMFKFRTMHLNDCADGYAPESSGDPRIVPGIGPFLRRTSLDELPQLWNVLMGDMSLVGPRPEMPFIVDTYDEMEKSRLSLKPGLTGLWQVSESRKAPIHENLDYDLYYIENQSIFLDLVILALTVFAVPFRGNH